MIPVWHLISEDKPPEDREVLVLIEGPCGRYINSARWYDVQKLFLTVSQVYGDVGWWITGSTHWQEMPSLPT